jgi:ABC-type Fe3+ transport system permease subunit
VELARHEKQLLLLACIAACVFGAFAGYVVLAGELEHQFHGGVLDEDKSAVMWHNILHTVLAFAEVALITIVALGVIPIWVRRYRKKVSDA